MFVGISKIFVALSPKNQLPEVPPDRPQLITGRDYEDDEKASRDRVALAHEDIESDDSSYYEMELVRAAKSVLSPLGWEQSKIRRDLSRQECLS